MLSEINVSRGIITDVRGRVLMIRRSAGAGIGNWTLPGGKEEAGEHCHQAGVREVAEEVDGADFTVNSLFLRAEIIDFEKQRRLLESYFVMDMHPTSNALLPQEGHDRLEFFHPDELPESISPGQLTVLNKFFELRAVAIAA